MLLLLVRELIDIREEKRTSTDMLIERDELEERARVERHVAGCVRVRVRAPPRKATKGKSPLHNVQNVPPTPPSLFSFLLVLLPAPCPPCLLKSFSFLFLLATFLSLSCSSSKSFSSISSSAFSLTLGYMLLLLGMVWSFIKRQGIQEYRYIMAQLLRPKHTQAVRDGG